MKYRLHLEGILEADGPDDAFAKIGDHFSKLSSGVIPPDLFLPGTEVDFDLVEANRLRPKKRSWQDALGRLARGGRSAARKD